MLGLPTILRTFGVSRNAYNKRKASGYLRRDVPEGSPGVATTISRDAALEIGFFEALQRARVEPAAATEIANRWIDRLNQKRGLESFHWFAGGMTFSTSNAQAPIERLRHKDFADLGGQNVLRPPIAVNFVDAGEVVQRVDAILAWVGSPNDGDEAA